MAVLSCRSLRTNLLADHSDALWELLKIVVMPKEESSGRIDFVLDNVGFEIVADLCLAEWLLTAGCLPSVTCTAKLQM